MKYVELMHVKVDLVYKCFSGIYVVIARFIVVARPIHATE